MAIVRNPIIGLRIAKNGDFIFEFFGEDGNRAEVVFTTKEDLEKAESGFNWSVGVKNDFDLYGWEEVQKMHDLEIDEMNDYQVIDDPDFLFHDDPDTSYTEDWDDIRAFYDGKEDG